MLASAADDEHLMTIQSHCAPLKMEEKKQNVN